jgi:hypothetical protein
LVHEDILSGVSTLNAAMPAIVKPSDEKVFAIWTKAARLERILADRI